MELDTIIISIQDALSNAQSIIEDEGFPTFESAKVTLQTEGKYVQNVGFKFLIVSFGKKWSREAAQQIVLTLKPQRIQEVGNTKLTAALVAALVDVARGMARAAAAGNAGPKLDLSALTVKVSFVVYVESKPGFAFEIAPISVDMGEELSEKAVHTVELSFQKPK